MIDRGLLEMLDRVVPCGRSLAYGARRAAMIHEPRYRSMLEGADDAERGRLLGHLGDKKAARAALAAALKRNPKDAAALAYRWELAHAGGLRRARVDFRDLDRACALEPKNAWWRVWRAAGTLVSVPKGKGHHGEAMTDEPWSTAQKARARRDLDAALKLEPRNVPALALAGRLGKKGALDRAIALAPDEGWLRQLRAEARWRAGDVDGFEKDLDAALLRDEWVDYFRLWSRELGSRSKARFVELAGEYLAKRPRSHVLLALRGDCRRYPELNDFSGAIADFEAALALKPGCAWVWAYLSRARSVAGDRDGALAAADRSITLAPKCGWLYAWRGEIHRRSGELKKALADFDAGLRLDPGYEFGYAWRGGVRRVVGEHEGAVADLSLAATLNPTYVWTRHELSLALRALGRYEEAFEALDAAARRDPKFGWCPRREDFPAALAELDRALVGDPNLAAAHAWKGQLLLRAGDDAAARRALDRALALRPRDPLALAWRGCALAEGGEPAAALRDLRRAVELDPAYAPAWGWKAWVEARLGRWNAALADLRRATRLEGRAAWLLSFRATAAAALGKQDEAADCLRAAVELNPRGDEARRLLARLEEAGAGRTELAPPLTALGWS